MQGTMIQFFHWNYPMDQPLWQNVASEAGNLSQLGITAVWLPPAFKPTNMNSVGYDAYDLYDLGEFDQKGFIETRYGSKEEYIHAIQALHEKDIKVYADVILNHKAGADEAEEVKAFEVASEDRTKKIGKVHKIKAFTKFTFPGRNNKYSSYKWDYQCFSGVDWDDKKQKKGIFKIINHYGKHSENVLSKENGNFDFLLFSDIEFRNKSVRKEFFQWGLWYLETTQIDGFRLDAVKHMRTAVVKKWLSKLRKKTGKEIFSVGEFAGAIDTLLKYIKKSKGCMSLFDFPLHKKFTEAAREGKDFDLQVRVVSMPSWELFDMQDYSYKQDIFPTQIRKRLAVEAGSPIGWQKYVTEDGGVIGINQFGASAPGKEVLEEYGYSIDNVVEKAKKILGGK